MNSESEVGSVIEERIYAAKKAQAGLTLGHEKHTCLRCGKDWGSANLCPHCGFNECSAEVIRPSAAVITGWGPNPKSPIIGTEATVSATLVLITESDLDSLRQLRSQLVAVEQALLQSDQVLHRILGRVPLNVGALFGPTKTEQDRVEREDRMRDPNREVWYDLQSVVHFSSESLGDTPLGAATPFNGSMVLQCRHLVSEIDRALAKYEEALRK